MLTLGKEYTYPLLNYVLKPVNTFLREIGRRKGFDSGMFLGVEGREENTVQTKLERSIECWILGHSVLGIVDLIVRHGVGEV